MGRLEDAINDLDDLQWMRLRKVAQILASRLPSLDGESLLFEALERTLDGRRTWKPHRVDFVGHLVGVMRSVSSHALARTGQTVALTSSVQLIGLENPEQALSAEEQLAILRQYFDERADQEALLVIDAMELGCDGPMIRSQLSIDQTRLETIVRRIRRSARRLLP